MRELHGLVILERTKLGKLDSDMVIWGKKLNFDGERFRSGTTYRHLSHLSISVMIIISLKPLIKKPNKKGNVLVISL